VNDRLSANKLDCSSEMADVERVAMDPWRDSIAKKWLETFNLGRELASQWVKAELIGNDTGKVEHSTTQEARLSEQRSNVDVENQKEMVNFAGEVTRPGVNGRENSSSAKDDSTSTTPAALSVQNLRRLERDHHTESLDAQSHPSSKSSILAAKRLPAATGNLNTQLYGKRDEEHGSPILALIGAQEDALTVDDGNGVKTPTETKRSGPANLSEDTDNTPRKSQVLVLKVSSDVWQSFNESSYHDGHHSSPEALEETEKASIRSSQPHITDASSEKTTQVEPEILDSPIKDLVPVNGLTASIEEPSPPKSRLPSTEPNDYAEVNASKSPEKIDTPPLDMSVENLPGPWEAESDDESIATPVAEGKVTHKLRKMVDSERLSLLLQNADKLNYADLRTLLEHSVSVWDQWQEDFMEVDKRVSHKTNRKPHAPRPVLDMQQWEDQKEADIYSFKWDPKPEKRGRQDPIAQALGRIVGGRELRRRVPTSKALGADSADEAGAKSDEPLERSGRKTRAANSEVPQEVEGSRPRRNRFESEMPPIGPSSSPLVPRRGRPPKNRSYAETPEPSPSDPQKKPRGRPRLNLTAPRIQILREESVVPTTEEEEDEEEEEEEEDDQDEDHEEDDDGSDAFPPAISTTAPVKRRGRPPKGPPKDPATPKKPRKKREVSPPQIGPDGKKKPKSATRSAAMQAWWNRRKAEAAASAENQSHTAGNTPTPTTTTNMYGAVILPAPGPQNYAMPPQAHGGFRSFSVAPPLPTPQNAPAQPRKRGGSRGGRGSRGGGRGRGRGGNVVFKSADRVQSGDDDDEEAMQHEPPPTYTPSDPYNNRGYQHQGYTPTIGYSQQPLPPMGQGAYGAHYGPGHQPPPPPPPPPPAASHPDHMAYGHPPGHNPFVGGYGHKPTQLGEERRDERGYY
jgi:hypothetical protein